MRTVLKHIVARTYKPFLERYLSRTRTYKYDGIELEIPPEVFHPGFFSSTQLLLKYILELPLKQMRVLELGAGSGLISMAVSREEADVSASDINRIAIDYIGRNCKRNSLSIKTINSDLFDDIPPQVFDIIAINPPYYKKTPVKPIDHAWYCGEKGEYFFKLFSQLENFIHQKSEVIMVACDGCDIQMIQKAANDHGYDLQCVLIKPALLERNFIFKIQRSIQ